jgi:hypothetical protein
MWLKRKVGDALDPSSRVQSTPSRLNGGTYDFWSGHLDWLRPSSAELDEEIGALCCQFAASGPNERTAFTQSLNTADSYAFQHFAQRAAVIGLRSGDVELLRRGLIAASAIDPHIIDWRDAGGPLPWLYYCLSRCGADAATTFEEVAQLAGDGMASILRTNSKRFAAYSSIGDLCEHELVCEVASVHGKGFLQPSIEPFEPGCDIIGLSLRAVEVLRTESKYQLDIVESASDLPAYWLWGRNHRERQDADDPLAVVTVQGRLRPEYDINPTRSSVFSQWLNIYLVETVDASTARHLEQTANDARHKRAAIFAVSFDSMVAIAFALTASETVRLVESRRTLERFREPLLEVLRGVIPS